MTNSSVTVSVTVSIAALLVAFNLLIYVRTLSYELVIDDIEWYDRIKTQHVFKQNQLYRLYGGGSLTTNLPFDHATTLLLHILTALLISSVSNPIAALLFSCHPANHQTAVWLNGRRYALINILILSLIALHAPWLLPLAIAPILLFAFNQYYSRRNLPYPKLSIPSLLHTIAICLYKLSGLHRPMFIYPYSNTLSIVPYSQPCAERHLSLPLILTCIGMSHLDALPWLLLPLYALKTHQLIPMYASIQSFYDYHLKLGITHQKQELLRYLYQGIK